MKREIEVQPEQVAAEPTAASTVKHLVSSLENKCFWH